MPSWLPMSWSVQVVQGSNGAGLALKPVLQIGISRDVLGQHLDGDGAVQAGVGGLVDLPYPAFAGARSLGLRYEC